MVHVKRRFHGDIARGDAIVQINLQQTIMQDRKEQLKWPGFSRTEKI